jgi:hypothetical protein
MVLANSSELGIYAARNLADSHWGPAITEHRGRPQRNSTFNSRRYRWGIDPPAALRRLCYWRTGPHRAQSQTSSPDYTASVLTHNADQQQPTDKTDHANRDQDESRDRPRCFGITVVDCQCHNQPEHQYPPHRRRRCCLQDFRNPPFRISKSDYREPRITVVCVLHPACSRAILNCISRPGYRSAG